MLEVPPIGGDADRSVAIEHVRAVILCELHRASAIVQIRVRLIGASSPIAVLAGAAARYSGSATSIRRPRTRARLERRRRRGHKRVERDIVERVSICHARGEGGFANAVDCPLDHLLDRTRRF